MMAKSVRVMMDVFKVMKNMVRVKVWGEMLQIEIELDDGVIYNRRFARE